MLQLARNAGALCAGALRRARRAHLVACWAAAFCSVMGPAAVASAASAQLFQPTRFQVEVVGKGPDILLITGMSSARVTWAGDVARLSKRHRLHLIQIDGFGGAAAGANTSGPVLEPTAGELAEYIKAEKLRRPIVIGHSLGGTIALELAEAHPEILGKLVVVDALPFSGVQFGADSVAQVAPTARAAREQMLALPPTAFTAAATANAERMVRSPAARTEVAHAMAASDIRTVAEASSEALVTDLRPKLGEITAPTLVIFASDSPIGLPAEKLQQIYANAYAPIPIHKIQQLPGTAHFVMLDQPKAFDAALDAFLEPSK